MTDFEMQQTEAHLHQNIKFMSPMHSWKSRKQHSALNSTKIQFEWDTKMEEFEVM